MSRKGGLSSWGPVWAVFVVLFVHLYGLHFTPDPRVVAQANSQYWVRVPVSTNRGAILDRNGIPLAVSVPAYSIFVDPKFWEPSQAAKLDGLLPPRTLSLLSSSLPGRFHWIARKISPDRSKPIQDLSLEGISFLKEKKRIYPQEELLSHVLGYCDIDDNGLAGIERNWDLALYAPPQIRFLIRDAAGNLLTTIDDGIVTDDTPGSVMLTIDSRFQHVIERRLDEGVRSADGKWGAAICIDPKTGDILASASWPKYNPNIRESFDPELLRNNVIGRVYEPGSTLKPIIIGISLEEKWISPHEKFVGKGSIKIADAIISNVNKRAFGLETPEDILINSCNVGMSQIGMRFDVYRAYETLRQWGLGMATGVELPGEEIGLLRPPDQWRGVVPANIAIGQGLALTPLQLAQTYLPIANGGKLLRLHVVRRVTDGRGAIVYESQREVLREVLAPATAAWLRRALRKVVAVGTGKAASTPLADVAGKTGTAQIADKGLYSENRYVASFAGFWPWEDPRFVLLIVIGEPAGTMTYGGQIAAPIFRHIVEDMYYLHFAEEIQGGRFSESD